MTLAASTYKQREGPRAGPCAHYATGPNVPEIEGLQHSEPLEGSREGSRAVGTEAVVPAGTGGYRGASMARAADELRGVVRLGETASQPKSGT